MFSAFVMTSVPYLLVETRLLSRVRVGLFLFTSQLVVPLSGICAFWGICSFPLLLVFATSCFTPDSFSYPTPVLVELISTTGRRVSSSKSNAISGTCRLFFFIVFFLGGSSISPELVVDSISVALRLPLFSTLSFCSFVATATSLLETVFGAPEDSGNVVMVWAVSRITLPAFLLKDGSSFEPRALSYQENPIRPGNMRR